MSELLYTEHQGKIIEAGDRFEHVMAIALDPTTNYKSGIARCIMSRSGDVAVSGFLDKSILCQITEDSFGQFKIGEKIYIKNEEEIINQMMTSGDDFLGLEDPDIWIDEKTNLMHVYFTMPVKHKEKHHYSINLGHAVGKDLYSLIMTSPALLDVGDGGAKEVSIAPLNSQGVRFNLIESSKKGKDFTYSTIRVAITKDMGESWEFGDTIFNPEDCGMSWISGHASPGLLFSKNFIDVGKNKLLGILNGREQNQKIGEKIKYGMFSVGLFIYDYENGKIDWVSPEPLIKDSEAKTITFASQFVETNKGEGILYAHVDDSFVRAYTLRADLIKTLLPAEFVL